MQVEGLSENLQQRKELIDQVLQEYFGQLDIPKAAAVTELRASMEYSAVRGGKRFRPVLCLLLAECFGVSPKRVLPLACAIEMIHTYSLIHDDLPVMDNDDLRRGEPTNHKVYGTPMALLAGDALLTEAFTVLSNSYEAEPDLALRLISLLGKAAGIVGMVGGQAIDIKMNGSTNLEELKILHAMKTGALIRICCEGTAHICGLPLEKIEECRKFGESLGLAFQVKDDLLDFDTQKDLASIPALLGKAEAKDFLQDITDSAMVSLQRLGITSGLLVDLVQFNFNREL